MAQYHPPIPKPQSSAAMVAVSGTPCWQGILCGGRSSIGVTLSDLYFFNPFTTTYPTTLLFPYNGTCCFQLLGSNGFPQGIQLTY
jgi:hypothetical protein